MPVKRSPQQSGKKKTDVIGEAGQGGDQSHLNFHIGKMGIYCYYLQVLRTGRFGWKERMHPRCLLDLSPEHHLS